MKLPSQAPKPDNILAQAERVIYGDREKTYGSPDQNLNLIADFWNSYLARKDNGQALLTAYDVCHMMALLKIARLRHSPTHKDSLIDLCGYAALVERVEDYKKGSLDELITKSMPNNPSSLFSKTEQNIRTTSNYPVL